MANLSNPTIQIDGVTVAYKPNSLSYKLGRGDMTQRTQQSGQIVETVGNIDSETKLSMVKFTMVTTDTSISLVDQWLETRKSGGSTIEIFEEDTSPAFQKMQILTEPETGTGSEGEIEVDFSGPPGQA